MPINQEDLWVSYLFCFFIPFCRFRGNNRFGGEHFPTEKVVIDISCCVTSIVWKSWQPLSICSTLKHGTFSTKILAFFTPYFFIATNIANKPLSDCITSSKTILPFHFSPKPIAEGETKRQQLQFHKINTKKKNICRTPTIWRQSNLPSNISQFVPWSKLSNLSALHWTLPIPKTRKHLKCIHSQINSFKHIKINWFSDCKWSQHYSKFPTTIPHLRE